MKKNISSYGVTKKHVNKSNFDVSLEELEIQGFTIIDNIIDQQELNFYRDKIIKTTRLQEDEFKKSNLLQINEPNVSRCLFFYDKYFLNLVTNKILIKNIS